MVITQKIWEALCQKVHDAVRDELRAEKEELDKAVDEFEEPEDPELRRQAVEVVKAHYKALLDPAVARDLFEKKLAQAKAEVEAMPEPEMTEEEKKEARTRFLARQRAAFSPGY